MISAWCQRLGGKGGGKRLRTKTKTWLTTGDQMKEDGDDGWWGREMKNLAEKNRERTLVRRFLKNNLQMPFASHHWFKTEEKRQIDKTWSQTLGQSQVSKIISDQTVILKTGLKVGFNSCSCCRRFHVSSPKSVWSQLKAFKRAPDSDLCFGFLLLLWYSMTSQYYIVLSW